MANNLGGVVDKYTQRLDAILEHETKTADLNLNSELVGEFSGNGKIEIATIAMDGLGDYSRANGFPAGDVDLSWDSYQLEHDRGREFSIDALDDEERELIVSANVMAEFARTKVVPEVDAIRFATLAANAGTTASAALTSSTIEDALLAAEAAISEKTDLDGTILYMTTTAKNLLRNNLRASHYFNFRRICRSIQLGHDYHDLGYVLLDPVPPAEDGTLGVCQPNKDFEGILAFKKSFGADYIEYVGEYALVLNKALYFSYTHLLEKAREVQSVVNRVVRKRR